MWVRGMRGQLDRVHAGGHAPAWIGGGVWRIAFILIYIYVYILGGGVWRLVYKNYNPIFSCQKSIFLGIRWF
jgi:hypothetical protein